MSHAWNWIASHWEFVVGAILGIAGVAIGVASWYIQRQPKQLDYQFLSRVTILHERADVLRGKLKMDYEGVPIKDPRIVTIRISNTGKRGISRDDFKNGQPITIKYETNPPFDGHIVGLSPELPHDAVGEVFPSAIDPFADDYDPTPQITPHLLSAGEWFDVQLLSDGPSRVIEIACRFLDQSRPMQDRGTLRAVYILERFPFIFLGLLTIFVICGSLVILLSSSSLIAQTAAFAAGLMITALDLSLLTKILSRDRPRI
jgi:hypothetical protein